MGGGGRVGRHGMNGMYKYNHLLCTCTIHNSFASEEEILSRRRLMFVIAARRGERKGGGGGAD